jgi:EAL domain-containing protein (putative c-di-GMP-specific phosphodiesterase class I)
MAGKEAPFYSERVRFADAADASPDGSESRIRISDPADSGSHPASASANLSELSMHAKVLVVDDEPEVLRSVKRALESRGYIVTTANDGRDAVGKVDQHSFDVVLSDIGMPGMDGIQLLREIREHDLHVPVVLITGEPAVSTAVQALEYGAMHYLSKPLNLDEVDKAIHKAVRLHRMAHIKQQAAELLGHVGALGADRAGLEASFERALQQLWVAYQPIVDAKTHEVYGYEALMRSTEPSLPHPGAMLDAAERLGTLDVLGRTVRNLAVMPMMEAPERGVLFVNLHVADLLDPTLASQSSPLSKIADRVVLEITERASLDEVKDARTRVATLRDMGFRIAVDDMGAGYAGLTSFALLEPEIIKLDMSLVRDVHLSGTKRKIIRSMTSLAKDMGMMVVAEGVETLAERDILVQLGCDLLQGFFLARPGKAFPEVNW